MAIAMPTEDDRLKEIMKVKTDPKLNARFGQTCATCGHSRANHLVDKRALNLFAIGACNVEMCHMKDDTHSTYDVAHTEHSKFTCKLSPCGCTKFETGVTH